MADKKKMRSPKLVVKKTTFDDDVFSSFVDGADPMHEGADNQIVLENESKPWDGLPKTPKTRLMLLVDPADKARLDFLSEKTGRSAQVILRSYIEEALREEASIVYTGVVYTIL